MEKLDQLNQDIVKTAVDSPGITVSRIVEKFKGSHGNGRPNETTIRRRVYKLGANEWLTLRNEVAVYPTEKCKKNVGVEPQAPERGEAQ